VGDRRVRLIEVGPAHTTGDVIVHVPDAGVVFAGDILFHGGHPVVWVGPVANWVAACDRIVELAPEVVVPGHGPIAGLSAVQDMSTYFTYLSAEARVRFDAGLTPMEAARDIDLSDYKGWGEAERVVVNITSLYREYGAAAPGDVATVFGQMAELAI
jgi:glyoxylase-like metal-dependent hydrolase (beta-lactamase superfamily II)